MNCCHKLRTGIAPIAIAALWATFVGTAAGAQVQAHVEAHARIEAPAASVADGSLASAVEENELNALERGRYAVLIDLDENRLYFRQGDVTLWSAPVGTGTGMRVITDDNDWDFSTPNGRFKVEYKERDPVWIAPDWFYVENNLPVPPTNHPSRYMRGTLGEAAIYISEHLAIHGTDRPELIGQRVSHGCIRLENRYTKRLYHNVQVGTEVIIVGGDQVKDDARVVDLRKGYDPSLAATGKRKPRPIDPVIALWKAMETPELLDVLHAHLDQPRTEGSRWDEVAVLLLERVRAGDDEALAGLISHTGEVPSKAIEREWATFLTDAYRAASVRTLAEMAKLEPTQRQRVAALIVAGSVTLFGGEFDDVATPWPTRQIARSLATRAGEQAWDALAAAEREHRANLASVADR